MSTFTYTSPQTSNVYEVVAVPQSRVDYREFMNPDTKYIREYTQYDIYLGGRQVQFTFEESGIAEAVSRFENPGFDISSRFD